MDNSAQYKSNIYKNQYIVSKNIQLRKCLTESIPEHHVQIYRSGTLQMFEAVQTLMQKLSDMTATKAQDMLNALQTLELIQCRKGQHFIHAHPKVLPWIAILKLRAKESLEVDISKLIRTPYKEQG